MGMSQKNFCLSRKNNNLIDETNEINGDAMLIVGDMESELKFESAKEFTKRLESVNEDIFCPRMLFGTPGHVGINYDQVNTIIKVGLSTSVLSVIQEMGRCGRRCNSRNQGEILILHSILKTMRI